MIGKNQLKYRMDYSEIIISGQVQLNKAIIVTLRKILKNRM